MFIIVSDEKNERMFLVRIKNSQKLELLKRQVFHYKIKLKRKVDLDQLPIKGMIHLTILLKYTIALQKNTTRHEIREKFVEYLKKFVMRPAKSSDRRSF
ncbi:5797_t:CDS:2 [Ambispora leptoticha]|uniref:5797_t:CDS:1 n=1 Tax=Ambispora leptoticha TaxID=144679 RepID=A0A9N9BMD3_9GLOM|nr:5797_t:CDS:2 [Ambispora leptoticha]